MDNDKFEKICNHLNKMKEITQNYLDWSITVHKYLIVFQSLTDDQIVELKLRFL
jgi:hypothetical protein